MKSKTTQADSLVIRYTTVNDCFFACVNNDKRQMDSCVLCRTALLLFSDSVSLY
jgi:hypothetical protein